MIVKLYISNKKLLLRTLAHAKEMMNGFCIVLVMQLAKILSSLYVLADLD